MANGDFTITEEQADGSLKKTTIPASGKAMLTAADAAAQRTLINANFPTILLPSGKNVIGNIPDSWATLASDTVVIWGNGVTIIDNYAFESSSLAGPLTLPSSVVSISHQAFYNCLGLTGTLTIPDSVTIIGASAFSNCSGFTGALIIPNSVTTIGNDAFRYCTSIESLTIGNSVVTIGANAFEGFFGVMGATIIIPDSVTTIGGGAFSSSYFAGVLTIPNSVTSIGNGAFMDTGIYMVNAYVTKTILDVTNALALTSVNTIHARASDATWTAGAGQTIGGKTGIEVIKDL